MKTCKTCGKATQTAKCDGCWEVERRLPDYIKTPGGRAFVTALLAKAAKPGETIKSVADKVGAALTGPEPTGTG